MKKWTTPIWCNVIWTKWSFVVVVVKLGRFERSGLGLVGLVGLCGSGESGWIWSFRVVYGWVW